MSTENEALWGGARYCVMRSTQTPTPSRSTFEVEIYGSLRWALECLIAAGNAGCCPTDRNWGGYIVTLRNICINVGETQEPAGIWRYHLQDHVTRLEQVLSA